MKVQNASDRLIEEHFSDDLEKAKKELNEDPKTRDETIKGNENLGV